MVEIHQIVLKRLRDYCPCCCVIGSLLQKKIVLDRKEVFLPLHPSLESTVISGVGLQKFSYFSAEWVFSLFFSQGACCLKQFEFSVLLLSSRCGMAILVFT